MCKCWSEWKSSFDFDTSLLDVAADIIGETLTEKPTSPWSFAEDVGYIVRPTSGRVDAAEPLSYNIIKIVT